MKTPFSAWTFLGLFMLRSATPLSAADASSVLPVGSAPAPIEAAWFPSRVHAFVWRNWNLVEPARLAKLLGASAQGINGVWLHVVLRDLAPGGKDFPEFGAGLERRLANLAAMVARAKRHGIGIYLYMNEPRGQPAAFFKDRPDLAGVFTITASENLTNCASHGRRAQCAHCKGRTDAEIIAEVNRTIEEGVHRGSPAARCIAWDWGWHGHGDAPDIVALLPKSMWLMSVSEWALPISRGGVSLQVGEYSMSAVGPGPRATRHWQIAKGLGLKTVAKVQLNNTWELSSVPYLPVMDLVAEHCHNLASAGVDGMMLSWSLGGYPSPNLEIAARFRGRPTPEIATVLDAVAAERFGVDGGPLARNAWAAFSSAFREYPYHGSVLYDSPVQIGPANPLYAVRTGYQATMTGIPYDDLRSWRGPYPADVFAAQFQKVATGWQTGIPALEAAVERAPSSCKDDARAELRFARVAGLHFQSVASQARFVMARDRLAAAAHGVSAAEQAQLLDQMKSALAEEIVAARQEFALAQGDSRIGFEAANQYFFVPLDLVEKVVNCRWLLEKLGN